MGFLDYIPFAATIKHALADPKGREIEDYIECKLKPGDCDLEPSLITARKLECQRCILGKQDEYCTDFIGGNMGQAFLNQTGNVAAGALLGILIKKLIKQAGGRVTVGAAGGIAGVVILGLDAAIDLGIVITKLNQIGDAARKAQGEYCNCPQG